MSARGIKCVDTSGHKHNLGLWHRIENGEYEIVYATPETILDPMGYFFKIILQNRKSAFHKKLVAITIDECHVAESWGKDFEAPTICLVPFGNTSQMSILWPFLLL